MMMDRQYMKNIAELTFSGYKFVLYYAETLNRYIAEFPHNHPMYEIYYVLEGDIRINIAGIQQRVSQGQACILSKDVRHHVYYAPDIPKRYFALIFDIVPCEQVSMNGPDGPFERSDIEQALQELNKTGFQLLDEPKQAADLVAQIQEEIEQRRVGWNTQAMLLCYRFFITTCREMMHTPVRDTQFSGHENLAMSVSMYIHAHYPENISLESVAKALNISPRHINRSYKAMLSTTFMKNANLLRIAYAKNYLCATNEPIEEIAEKVGFRSTRVLYKLFQQYEGLSPSQYRMLHKDDEHRKNP